MEGAKTKEERMYLFENAEKIIFISQWIKKRFLSSLDDHYAKSSKFFVIYHSANKVPLNFNLKEKCVHSPNLNNFKERKSNNFKNIHY